MSILGLSAGMPDGSAEILLKEALQGVQNTGAEVELVRLVDLALPTGAQSGQDDAGWFWDRLMESDGIIVSTPIYSRTVPGLLRLLGDRISGPQADVGFTAEILRMRSRGEYVAVDFPIDERVLRPRVAGFIAVGGSLPGRWKTLALPLLHTLTESAQIAVVDQVEFAGAGGPASIILQPDALQRSRTLGANVGSQVGRTFDEAEYRGAPGTCPVCHLSVIVMRGGDAVECATCGAAGTLRSSDGQFVVDFSPQGRSESVLSLGEKVAHFHEVQATAASQLPKRAFIEEEAARYAGWGSRVLPPSTAAE